MKAGSQSEKLLDKQIAGAEAKLAELRKKKLTFLQNRMKEAEQALRNMQSNLGGSGVASIGRSKKASRGGPRGPRLTDQQAIDRLTKEVKAAGSGGISARSAAQKSGVFYLRAIKLMDATFKKSGTGKWTRYRA